MSAVTERNSPHARFFGALTPDLSRQMLALPEVLERHSDWFVLFTARKSVCVADALAQLGYWSARGDFSSNRALDGDCAAIRGRKVLIVEDIAASCRTLKSTLDRVRAAGGADVRCFALSMEGPREDWEELLDTSFESPYLQSDIHQSLRHTRSLIDALWVLPRTYNIDWPTRRFAMKLVHTDLLDAGWRLVSPAAGDQLKSIVLEPGPQLMAALREALPGWMVDVLVLTYLAKVRIYPLPEPQREGTRTFVVPVVALGAMSTEEIASRVRVLDDVLGSTLAVTLSPSEQYRALQYLFGELLLHVLLASARLPTPKPDPIELRYLFLPPACDCVAHARDAIGRYAGGALRRIGAPRRRTVQLVGWEQLEGIENERHEAEIFLSDLFLTSYVDTREYALRDKLHSPGTPQERREIVSQLVSLDRGVDGASFTAGELSERLKRDCSSYQKRTDARRLVSTFLDTAIDTGRVVPDIHPGPQVSRRFRAGEIISYDRDTQAQVERMLHSFVERREALEESLGQAHSRATRGHERRMSIDLTQKLIVGYITYLLGQQKLADHRDSGFSVEDEQRVQRRSHLRGAVLDEVSSDFVAHGRVPESISRLVTNGVLEKAEKGYELPVTPVLDEPQEETLLDSSAYGQVLADAMSVRDEAGTRIVDDHTLARLVSLQSPVDQALALGGDLTFAFDNEQLYIRWRDLRQLFDSKAFKAINQGLTKGWWIKEKRGREVVEAVRERLVTSEPLARGATATVLRTLTPREGGASHTQLIRRLTAWFVDAHCLMTLHELRISPPQRRATIIQERITGNRAFQGLGGLRSDRPRARGELHRRLADPDDRVQHETGADLAASINRLATDVARELDDAAHELRVECYELHRQGLIGRPQDSLITRCLLVRSHGSELAALRAVGGRINELELEGERLPGGYDVMVVLEDSFDLASAEPHIAAALREANSSALLIEAMSGRFCSWLDPAGDTVIRSRGFVDLIELSEGKGAARELLFMAPTRSETNLCHEARARRRDACQQELLGEEWEVSVLGLEHQPQQLALGETPPAQRARDSAWDRGDGGAESEVLRRMSSTDPPSTAS
jgi:hypothetical protein